MGKVKSAFRDEIATQASHEALDTPRDSRGRFTTLHCVGAHDRCFGGAGGPCPFCEPREAA